MDTLSCTRGRELVSLELDGEISELEGALLSSHLAVCGHCRTFRAQIEPATALLRAAPLVSLERAIALPPRRAIGMRALQVGAAAAVVAITGAGSLLVGQLGGKTQTPARAANAVVGADSMRALQIIRREEYIPKVKVGKAGGRLPL